MRPQGLQLELDDVADVDDDVGLSEGDEEEGLGFVRLEMLALPELRKHLARRCVGVDGPEDDLRSGDVVGMVHVPTAVAHRRVHGDDHVGTVDPHALSLSQCEAKGSGLPGGAFTLPFERTAVAEIVTTWAMRARRHLSCGDGPGRRCTMAGRKVSTTRSSSRRSAYPFPSAT